MLSLRLPSLRHSLTAVAAVALFAVADAQINRPQLTANSGMTVAQLEERTITRAMLNATDLDASGLPSDLADIEFVIDVRDPVTFAGTLKLYSVPGGRAVQPGEVITLENINDGLLRYRADIANQLFDNVLFRLRDIDGNYVILPGTGQPAVFNFPITITQLNTAPSAGSGSGTLGIGGTFEGTLTATDHDIPAQTLTFSLVTPPPTGTVELLNATTGAFRYTATPGFEGSTSFTFQVTDGLLSSASAGVFTLTVQNQAPAVANAFFEIPQNRPFSASLAASDPDLPAQALTFAITQPPEKGSVTIAPNGTFVYTPHTGRFGEDAFRVVANDGRLNSGAATISFEIDHQPVAGDLFIATKSRSENDPSSSSIIAAIDPDQFDLSMSSGDGLLTSLRALTYSRWNRRLYVIEGDPGAPGFIIEIDPATGAQREVFSGSVLQFPLGLAASDDGYLYIANAPLVLGEPVDQSGPGSQIIRVDLRDGSHTIVLEDGPLHFPTGLCFGADGALYIADAEMFALGAETPPSDATILRLDLTSGVATTIASGQLLQDPFGLLALPNGSFLVSELRGDIVRVDAQGNQTLVYDAVDGERAVTALARDENGTVFATAFALFGGNALPAILRIENPEGATPSASVFLEGIFLGEPFGLAAVTEHANWPAWQAGYFSAADRANPALEATVWGDNADPDGDGLPNLLEFALNLSPTAADSGARVLAPYLRSAGGSERLALTISRRLDASLSYVLEASSDLVTWETIGGANETSISGTSATFEDNTALDVGVRRFIRLRVSRL